MHRGFGRGFGHRGFGMRGFGWGMMPFFGLGGSLLTGLMVGGLGYLLGSQNASLQQAQNVQQMPAHVYPLYQASQGASAPQSDATDSMLSQLKLLGELHDSGVLTDEEFIRQKRRLMDR